MKRSWKERWWDVRDTIIENLEEFLTSFWQEGIKKAWHPAKALLGLGVIMTAGVLMIHNWLSDGPPDPLPGSVSEPPEYREPSSSTEIPSDVDMNVNPSGDEEEDEGVSKQDEKEMKELGIAFVKEYTTYKKRDLKARAEKIRPYVIKDIYKAEKKAAEDVPDIPLESHFDKVNQIRVQSQSIREKGAAQMIWLGTVYSVVDDEEVKERIQLTLIPDGGGWKVAEVIYP